MLTFILSLVQRSSRNSFVVAVFLLSLAVHSAATDECLVIQGTGDCQTLLEVLARTFTTQTGIPVEIPASVGTIGGIKRLLNGEITLARTARPLSAEESSLGLNQRIIAYTPVVFVANFSQDCDDNLTAEQIVAIYSGKLTSWEQLGSKSVHKIYVANREDGDSSRRILSEQIPGFSAIDPFAGEILYSTPETLRILQNTPYTIGYLPLASAHLSKLKIFSYQGVAPSIATVQSESYPLVVPLGIAWKGQLTGTAKEFADFLVSPQGRQLIEDNGAVPLAN